MTALQSTPGGQRTPGGRRPRRGGSRRAEASQRKTQPGVTFRGRVTWSWGRLPQVSGLTEETQRNMT